MPPCLALPPVAAPPAGPSPPPACVSHDQSGGYRAQPTLHAVRRFADRIMGLEPVLEGLTDWEAVDAIRRLGYDVPGIRRWLAYYGYPGPRWGAHGVTVGRVGLVLQGPRVVTVVMRGEGFGHPGRVGGPRGPPRVPLPRPRHHLLGLRRRSRCRCREALADPATCGSEFESPDAASLTVTCTRCGRTGTIELDACEPLDAGGPS